MVHNKIPTRSNVQKVLGHLKLSEGIIYLNGNVMQERDNTDCELPFRQESNFYYVTGVNEPDFHVVIDIATKKTILVAPNIDPDHVMWMGLPDTLEEMQAKYDVDQVVYADKLNALVQTASKIYTLPISKTTAIDSVSSKLVDAAGQKKLENAFIDARLIKADWEVEIMRKANKISSDAHIKLWKAAHPGCNEAQLHALFLYESARHGAFFQSYFPIVGSGMNAATLHYNKNNAIMNANDVVLVDAGAEFELYASDITRVFPVNGKFTPEARVIYSIVLEMQKKCIDLCKAGVAWEDIHYTATEVGCDGLLKTGILVGDKQEILDKSVMAAFFPHGIGHSIGMDVHDVGGYPDGVERINKPGIRNLRMRRVLAPGFAVTVEPGIYFFDYLINPVLNNADTGKYINVDVLNKYKSVGGVRIEDNIIVTEGAPINLTTVPKEIDQIEALMASN
ncbi:peptidase M24, structural domain-containing protein [Halteromyces radiatus]|uniref:peptidase M24, structural domain-containing protein n=1 Tax=Halteromyces radiatus TaxID=101107 RepID=UPI002220DAFC|nr:peptidase M24, structural domain-containing protein [Halteromyces radiatus]KAI8086706.1 peptidase M24, structural domain-containing protein [Halteromyces radiatus]